MSSSFLIFKKLGTLLKNPVEHLLAQVHNRADPHPVHQVIAQIITHALSNKAEHHADGNHRPDIADEGRNEVPQIKLDVRVRNGEDLGRCIVGWICGVQDAREDQRNNADQQPLREANDCHK